MLPHENVHSRHSYYVYVVEHPTDRDGVSSGSPNATSTAMSRIAGRSTPCAARADLGYREGQFPVTERKAKQIFSLPMYPHLKDEEEVDTVIAALKEVI